MDIKIKYDGAFPNLCSGTLVVIINNKEWEFPQYCLLSGGDVSFDEDGGEIIATGEWIVTKWPEDFPKNLKEEVINAVNSNIPQGCCGGCV